MIDLFDDVIGHETVIELLQAELASPAQAYLFVGAESVGKHHVALRFAAGLLSGAGYALFENFSLGASAGDDWAMIVVARIGTSLIHIVTTGLMGWALALAWKEKRYMRLGVSYLAAVFIHGLWNSTVILTAGTEIFGTNIMLPDFARFISAGAPLVFAVLVLGSFVLLLTFNATLRQSSPQASDTSTGFTNPSGSDPLYIPGDDIIPAHFAEHRVRHADARGHHDLGVLGQEVFHFHRIHIESPLQVHFFFSAHQGNIPLVVDIAHVPGFQPAVLKSTGSFIAPTEVRRNNCVALEVQFPGFTNRHFNAVVVNRLNLSDGALEDSFS